LVWRLTVGTAEESDIKNVVGQERRALGVISFKSELGVNIEGKKVKREEDGCMWIKERKRSAAHISTFVNASNFSSTCRCAEKKKKLRAIISLQ